MAYQPIGVGVFSAENIRNCEKHVLSIQRRLDEVVANNDKEGIRETFNLLTRNTKAVKVLATWRITQRNKGKYTAGVDKVAIPKGADWETRNRIKLQLLEDIDIRKTPDLIRRTFIPKANGKKRPLGIPTLHDRIVQEIFRIATEPIVEYHFSDNSFGFRPKRSCQDAMSALYKKLAKPKCKRYVVEGDIKGCFDNINHNHIINTLENWLIPNWATQSIRRMLESGIFYNGEVYDSDSGTPQGGVISPLLANVALTTLDNFCSERYGRQNNIRGWKTRINPIVRYADDFVILCQSEPEATRVKEEIAEHLSEKVGLTLSEEKTKITHISKGFDFLGFNFRKYPKLGILNPNKDKRDNQILLIKPQKEKVSNLLKSCKEILTENKNAEQAHLIIMLNQKLIGWGMYYRHIVSNATFGIIDNAMWWSTYRWSKRRHPNKPKYWIIRKYYSKLGVNKSRYFTDKETNKQLFRLSSIPIRRFVKVKSEMRVYDKDPQTIAYWNKREYTNAYSQIHHVKVRRLYSKQKGICLFCKGQTTYKDIERHELQIHHMKPVSLGGDNNYRNLRLIHKECHSELHSKFSKKEMSTYIDRGIDYMRKDPNKTGKTNV